MAGPRKGPNTLSGNCRLLRHAFWSCSQSSIRPRRLAAGSGEPVPRLGTEHFPVMYTHRVSIGQWYFGTKIRSTWATRGGPDSSKR